MKKKYDIKGMTCSACQAHVEKAVKNIDGVCNVNVNLINNTLELETDNVDDKTIISAVESVGYGAVVYAKLDYEKKDHRKRNRLIVSIILLVFLMYIAMGSMIGLPLPSFLLGHKNALWFSLSQILFLIPIVVLNFNYFISGYNKLFKGHPNMDSLVALGATASILYGIYGMFRIGFGLVANDMEIVEHFHMELYFEGAGTILTLVSIGKYIELKSKTKTSNAISDLLKLQGTFASIERDGKEIVVEIKDIQIGDNIKLSAGNNAPVDGEVIKGEASFNEASLTGESMPVQKDIGSKILSGTTNIDGYVLYKATTTSGDSTIAKIVSMVDEASSSKAPIAKLADKVSGVFVPIVLVLSLLTLIVWWIVTKSFESAIGFAIPVLVISCPCALGLATPIAIMITTGVAAKNHILIRNAEALEKLSKVNTVIFDKTGTLTSGELHVVYEQNNDEKFLGVLSGIEKLSSHPLAVCVTQYCERKNVTRLEINRIETIPGKGIVGVIGKKHYYVGNQKFIQEQTNLDVNVDTQNASCVVLADNKKILGYLLINDTVKETSISAVAHFKKLGLRTVMLTGDNSNNAYEINKVVKADDVISDVLPQQKSEIVKSYQQGGSVLMIGDGINDAVALETSDVGMAIGAGSDIAIESADLVLIKNDLMDAYHAYKLSKRTINNIKMNLFWAFFYNAISIPVAMGVFYPAFKLKLSPMIASLAMCFSSVFVVLNAMRLFIDKKEKNKIMETRIIVEGMMCEHCKRHVTEALTSLPGVKAVDVNLQTGEVIIHSDAVLDEKNIKSVIERAGYSVKK